MSALREPEAKSAVLLRVRTPKEPLEAAQTGLAELERLWLGLGGVVHERMIQTRSRLDPATVIGSGKLTALQEKIAAQDLSVVLFDHDLSPRQGTLLEKRLGVIVLDRTQLILEVFSQNAQTREARLQVELAEAEYMLPRLRGMWAHLDRERGGIAGSKGTGEKQIDIDRTKLRQRILRLKRALSHLESGRNTQGKRRQQWPKVALVGYTNAGKSSLMRRLTAAPVEVADRLFTTLDSTTRCLAAPLDPPVLVSDTVGFLEHLPHHLVASFRSTFAVVREADLLLHVVDASAANYVQHLDVAERVLTQIAADRLPRLLVLNKIDRLPQQSVRRLLEHQHPEALLVSALDGSLDALLERVLAHFSMETVHAALRLGYHQQEVLAALHRFGEVSALRYEKDAVYLRVAAPRLSLERLLRENGGEGRLLDAAPSAEDGGDPSADVAASGRETRENADALGVIS